jgi:hypothetical protein
MAKNKGLIPYYQFGCRQRHSTIEQTHRIVQTINKALESKHYSSAAFQKYIKHSTKYGIQDSYTS